MTKEVKYYVSGTHCASCELIIERKLLELDNIQSVSVSKDEVLIGYSGDKPSKYFLNKYFVKEGYQFFSQRGESQQNNPGVNWLIVVLSIILTALLYLLVQKAGLAALIRVDATSSLPSFILFGLLAGFSTCAALIGGIILGLSKKWNEQHHGNSLLQKIMPHLQFNAGRIVSYGLFGAILGGAGRFLRLSPAIAAVIIILISLYMLATSLQLLGIQALKRLQIRAPKSVTRYTAHPGDSKSKLTPYFIGALTFILPCGFTLTTQSLALISGSAIQGALIMLAFALGTLIPLLAIGVGSTALYENKNWATSFSRIAGILLLIFAIYNFNAGLSVLGIKPSLLSFTEEPAATRPSPAADDIQAIKMDAGPNGYSPNYFKVQAGKPVRWEIFDSGTSGCTNAIISKNLFSGQIQLVRGKTVTKEFTPTKPGKYRFSCWMGMVSGTIEVQ